MTIKQTLDWAIKNLKDKKIDSSVLDAEVLLSFVLKKNKTFLSAYSEKNLTKNQEEKFKKLIARRATREPVAYITNKKEFYGLNFYVDKNVLIPRPETELMVEEVIKIIKSNTNDANKTQMTRIKNNNKINLIDVGVGSGCILISILKWILTEFILAEAGAGMTRGVAGIANGAIEMTVGVDSSTTALKIVRKNARKHKVLNRTQFVYSNLLENIKLKNNASYIITANLPYLTTEQYKNLPPEIKKYEPKSALVAGKNGLKYYRELLKQIARDANLCSSQILLEIDSTQKNPIKQLIKKYLPKAKIKIKKDLAGLNRLVIINSNK